MVLVHQIMRPNSVDPQMSLPAAQVAEGRVIEGWFPLLDTYGEEPMKNAHHQVSSLYIRLQYQNVLQVSKTSLFESW